jgi:hypothetical protein
MLFDQCLNHVPIMDCPVVAGSTLALLMARVGADDPNDAFAPDDLAILA